MPDDRPISAKLFLPHFQNNKTVIFESYGFADVREVILQYHSSLKSYLRVVGAAQWPTSPDYKQN